MRLKNDTENFAASFNITPPYQMRVIHSSKLIYPREIYQRACPAARTISRPGSRIIWSSWWITRPRKSLQCTLRA